jgi:hypothetical protein
MISLCRYAAHEFAAKASCGVLRQAWRPLWSAAIKTSGCKVTPERSQLLKGASHAEWYATAHETQRGEAHWGLQSCTSEEEAVDKLPCGHAVQKTGERVDGELFKRADTAAIEAASVNRSVHQLLTWTQQWPGNRVYSPEC